MDAFVWRDSFDIGDKELDNDHRRFFDLLNDCYLGACSPGRTDPGLIHRIREYAAMHFSYEEQVMRSSGFPDLVEHEKRHQYFEARIAEFEQDHAGGQGHGYESMFSFLLEWFQTHILEDDMKFGLYQKSRGGPLPRQRMPSARPAFR